MPKRAEIQFRATTIVTSLPRDIYSDCPKNNTTIKFTLIYCNPNVNRFTIQIDLFKYKRFKDEGCAYKNTGSSHLRIHSLELLYGHLLAVRLCRLQLLFDFLFLTLPRHILYVDFNLMINYY